MYGRDRKSFEVTLPSNASNGDFPSNTITQYKTKLPIEVELEGDWKVALVKMILPHRFKNFKKTVKFQLAMWFTGVEWKQGGYHRGLHKFIGEERPGPSRVPVLHKPSMVDIGSKHVLTDHEMADILGPQPKDKATPPTEPTPAGGRFWNFHVGEVRAGFYQDLGSLGATLADSVNEHFAGESPVRFRWDPMDNMTRLTVHSKSEVKDVWIMTEPDEDVAMHILGFKPDEVREGRNLYKLPLEGVGHPIKLWTPKLAYVYTDLIKYEIVGHTQVPLLDIATISGPPGQLVEYNFGHLRYHEVCRNKFDECLIQITDGKGDPLPIDATATDEITVVLSFKRRKLLDD